VPIRQTGAFPIRKLDYVDIFKIKKYIMENTFKVEKLDAVNREIAELTSQKTPKDKIKLAKQRLKEV
ncbi:MAG: hypothetical protein IKX42_10790, partial [Fibrobacter sp.]|nr:hypothetical protein [Fibrobacter sp.]